MQTEAAQPDRPLAEATPKLQDSPTTETANQLERELEFGS